MKLTRTLKSIALKFASLSKAIILYLNRCKLFIILCCICSGAFITIQYYLWNNVSKPNEFGDAAGFINGWFSALAFAGVIYAIILQKKDLELQKEELSHTRKELEGQKAEFKIQNETLRRQRFENTFFNLMQQQLLISDNISISYTEYDNSIESISNKRELKGREVFKATFEDVPQSYDGKQTSIAGMRGILEQYNFASYANSLTPTYFDHYFRHLYRILKYIDKTDLIQDVDKYEYAAILRSQLSRYELIWLYYNGLSEYGIDKFKPLIEKYSMLKNLRKDMLVNNLNIGVVYSIDAFEKSNNIEPC